MAHSFLNDRGVVYLLTSILLSVCPVPVFLANVFADGGLPEHSALELGSETTTESGGSAAWGRTPGERSHL